MVLACLAGIAVPSCGGGEQKPDIAELEKRVKVELGIEGEIEKVDCAQVSELKAKCIAHVGEGVLSRDVFGGDTVPVDVELGEDGQFISMERP